MNEQKMTHIWCILRVLMNILLHLHRKSSKSSSLFMNILDLLPLNFLNFNINLRNLFPNTQKECEMQFHQK